MACGKDWPIKAHKQNKLFPDPGHSGGFGKSGHSLTANLFDGLVLYQEYIIISTLLNTNAKCNIQKSHTDVAVERLTTPTPSVKMVLIGHRTSEECSGENASQKMLLKFKFTNNTMTVDVS